MSNPDELAREQARKRDRRLAKIAMMKAGTAPRPANRQAAAKLAPCVHLGKPTGDVVKCGPCGGNVSLKVLACAVHGRCTPAKKVDGIACCATCPQFTHG